MSIEIRKLCPEDADNYVHFFDVTDHDDNVAENKCYCCCWSNEDCEGKDFSKVENRREFARQYVRDGNIQGYLVYSDNQVVGWCNANNKADCLKCESWRRFMDFVPLEDVRLGVKVKSVFCFVIAPNMRGKGIATQILKQICEDARKEGYDYVEAYPFTNVEYQSSDFGGYPNMYKKCGFYIHQDSEHRLVMRKKVLDKYIEIRKRFEENRDDVNAIKMSNYMRNKFDFYGISAPKRKALYKEFIKLEKKTKMIDWTFLHMCYEDNHREFQYLAYDYLLALKQFVTFEDISKIKKFIVTKSWWDTIDFLCKVIGDVGLRDTRVKELMLDWSTNDNI